MEYLPLISLLANVALPPVVNLVKSVFGIKDTPQDTLSNLASTKPEVLPQYIDAQSKYLESETKYFQRDITGTPSQWVIDMRASIRPFSVIASFIVLFASFFIIIQPPILITVNGVIGNWIGSKIEIHK